MSGELIFAGTRVEVKTLIDYLKADHPLDESPTFSGEQAEGYLRATLETADTLTTVRP